MLGEQARVGLGDSGGCVKDIDWGFGKVDSLIATGLFSGSGYSAPMRAGASLLFVDGWWL